MRHKLTFVSLPEVTSVVRQKPSFACAVETEYSVVQCGTVGTVFVPLAIRFATVAIGTRKANHPNTGYLTVTCVCEPTLAIPH